MLYQRKIDLKEDRITNAILDASSMGSIDSMSPQFLLVAGPSKTSLRVG